MKYILSYTRPHRHFIDIECIIENVDTDQLTIQLPAWRPGRYELGNFAKNIQKWEVTDENGKKLSNHKVLKDQWLVNTKGVKNVHIRYNYYASELNAGSSYLDDHQLYVNPVNCCVYVPERLNENCIVEIMLPIDYKIACSLQKVDKYKLLANDYHELVDSPFIASKTMQHNMFILDGVEFNLWFQGECKLDWSKIINDFFIFINEQFLVFKEFVGPEYHFLFQIVPYRFHHGVEHVKSTVIALGPSYNLMQGDLYNEFLGVSSHELFHCWNIKTIRPTEMLPYDYTKENYSRLGYVYEGVTTYYGDLMLFRSGVYSEHDFFTAARTRVQRHFDNYGRFNMSVADSSFDTWLDGYNQGIPNRKVSIYDEGAIIAFMSDMIIRKNTGNKSSLDNVMYDLYHSFAKENKGYTETDYKKLLEKYAGVNLDDFFAKYVHGVESYELMLQECFEFIGAELQSSPSKKYYETYYGFKIREDVPVCKVSAVFPDSLADRAGIAAGDEIIAINNISLTNNLAELTKQLSGQKVELSVNTNGITRKITITPGSEQFYKRYFVTKVVKPTIEQKKAYDQWAKRKF